MLEIDWPRPCLSTEAMIFRIPRKIKSLLQGREIKMWKTIIGVWAFGIFIIFMMDELEMTYTFFFGIPPVYAILGGLIVFSIILLYFYLTA
ncbi:hypothetical protein ES702_06918 [subsurface metagenome]